MRTVTVTAEDRRLRGLAPERLAAAAAAVRDDGFVVLADAVDPAHIAVLRDRVLADIPRLVARTDPAYNWNRGNLQQSAPRDPACLFADVLANDQAVAVCAALMGAGIGNAFYSGNTALPGVGGRQPVHVDTGHLWPVEAGIGPAHAFVVNVPLVDMDVANGAIELWPASHRVPAVRWGEPLEVPAEALARRRAVSPPFQPSMRAGSLLVRDIRLWHAGMPNGSAAPRPMLAMIYCAPWWPLGEPLELPRAAQAALAHPLLRTHARWVDHAVDHIGIDRAYGYAEAAAT